MTYIFQYLPTKYRITRSRQLEAVINCLWHASRLNHVCKKNSSNTRKTGWYTTLIIKKKSETIVSISFPQWQSFYRNICNLNKENIRKLQNISHFTNIPDVRKFGNTYHTESNNGYLTLLCKSHIGNSKLPRSLFSHKQSELQ